LAQDPEGGGVRDLTDLEVASRYLADERDGFGKITPHASSICMRAIDHQTAHGLELWM